MTPVVTREELDEVLDIREAVTNLESIKTELWRLQSKVGGFSSGLKDKPRLQPVSCIAYIEARYALEAAEKKLDKICREAPKQARAVLARGRK